MAIKYQINQTKPISVMFYLIDACNMHCSYCYNKQPRTNKFLNSKNIINFLVDINKKTKRLIDIQLVGGEPTLYPNILVFIKQLRSFQFIKQIIIFTNFSLPYSFYDSLFKYNINLVCSWHSEINDVDFCQKLSQIDVFYLKNISEIALMFEQTNSNRWNYVINCINDKYHNIIKPWTLFNQETIQKYSNESKKFFVTTLSKFKFIDLKKYLTQSKDIYTHIFDELSKKYYSDTYYNMYCTAGIDMYYVHVDGNVYRCQNDFFYNNKPLYNINQNNGIFLQNYYIINICKCIYCRHENYRVSIFNEN